MSGGQVSGLGGENVGGEGGAGGANDPVTSVEDASQRWRHGNVPLGLTMAVLNLAYFAMAGPS